MDNTPTSLEILRMARELVLNEHQDRRANIHNQWLVDADNLLMTQRLRLAYPPIPPHPTEADIIARAQILFDFLYAPRGVETAPEVEATPVVEALSTPLEAPIEQVAEPQKEIVQAGGDFALIEPEPIVEPEPEPIKSTEVVPVIVEPASTSNRILPNVLKKLEGIRGRLK